MLNGTGNSPLLLFQTTPVPTNDGLFILCLNYFLYPRVLADYSVSI